MGIFGAPDFTAESISDSFFQPELSEGDFEYFRERIRERVGIHFQPKKQDLVRSRLLTELRRLRLTSFAAYRDHLAALADDDSDWQRFTNLLTTNKTSFFREPEHFDFLTSHVVPEWKKNRPGESFRVWSCASSTGEELYSLSMALHSEIPEKRCDILGTDIDTEVLAHARNGVYRYEQFQDIPAEYRSLVSRGRSAIANWMRVRPEVKQRVRFETHNLMEDLQGEEPFDVIFCRNVLFYFDKPTLNAVVERLRHRLRPGGYLFVSHSEAIQPARQIWERAFASVYRRKS